MQVAHPSRSFALRQAGLIDVCSHVKGNASDRVALIDGAVDLAHPALAGCQITRIGESRSRSAGEHATFNASILVAGEAGQRSRQVLAICPGCTLLNLAVVTDDMLTGALSILEVAKSLASAVDLAVKDGCRVILFGIEMRFPQSSDWAPLSAALRAANSLDVVTILPGGNSAAISAQSRTRWAGAVIAASCNYDGDPSSFSPLGDRSSHMIFAPGQDIPGAGLESGYTVRSGTSFAGAIAAGAFALAKSILPDHPMFDLVANLCRPPGRILDGRYLLPKVVPIS